MDSELFGDYERLLKVEVLGRHIEVPEKNTLLRGLQFAAPDAVSYGRFCWNGSCANCTVTVHDGVCESKKLACRLDACDGLQVTSVSPELQRNLTITLQSTKCARS